MSLRVLHPAGHSADEAVGRLREQISVPAHRPYVIANFIATADGSIALGGESGTIAAHAPGDRRLFMRLREQADAVLAGTGTIAGEGYRRILRKPEARARREAAGLPGDPLAVVLSRSGELPEGVPMLDDDAQPKRIFLLAEADPDNAFAVLREDGVELLLCEGGPALLGDLIRRDLVDELFLTYAPVLGSGEPERTLLAGPADHPRRLELRALLEEGSGLHARYAILAGGGEHAADRSPAGAQPR